MHTLSLPIVGLTCNNIEGLIDVMILQGRVRSHEVDMDGVGNQRGSGVPWIGKIA